MNTRGITGLGASDTNFGPMGRRVSVADNSYAKTSASIVAVSRLATALVRIEIAGESPPGTESPSCTTARPRGDPPQGRGGVLTYGEGRVVPLGLRARHRAQTPATRPFLFNALYWPASR